MMKMQFGERYEANTTDMMGPYVAPSPEEMLGEYQAWADAHLVNLTPHTITLVTEHGNVTVPPSGMVARCEQNNELVMRLGCGVMLYTTGYGQVEGLPDQQPGKWLLVSSMVRAACPNRLDLVSPIDMVRDDQGRVIGCRALGATESDRWHE